MDGLPRQTRPWVAGTLVDIEGKFHLDRITDRYEVKEFGGLGEEALQDVVVSA